MPTTFIVVSENNLQAFNDVSFEDATITYQFDFSPWAEDNNTVTSVVWSVEQGDATISNESLTSNVAEAQVNFPSNGGSSIKLVADTGTEKYVVWLNITAKSPRNPVNDFGLLT